VAVAAAAALGRHTQQSRAQHNNKWKLCEGHTLACKQMGEAAPGTPAPALAKLLASELFNFGPQP